jgi:actin-related protein
MPSVNKLGSLLISGTSAQVSRRPVFILNLCAHVCRACNSEQCVSPLDIVPVVDGVVTPSATRQLAVGGKDLTARLRDLLAQRSLGVSDFDARGLLEKTAFVREAEEPLPTGSETVILADGRSIDLGAERHECTEMLFQTRSYATDGSGCSLGDAVHESIISCAEGYDKKDRKEVLPVEKELRVRRTSCFAALHIHTGSFAAADANGVCVQEELFRNVLICGGCACIPGMRERLSAELLAIGTYGVEMGDGISPPYYMPGCLGVDVRQNATLRLAPFLGGCIVAHEHKMFDSVAITKELYAEYGPCAIDRLVN